MNVQYRYPLQIYTLGDEVAKLTQDSKVYRVGHASDPCVVLRYEGDRKKIRFEGIQYLPYQLVHLQSVYTVRTSKRRAWWLPQKHLEGSDSISHLCNNKLCISQFHLLAEPLYTVNIGRGPCFDAIEKYLEGLTGAERNYRKHTFMSCFGRMCPHGANQCFISKGKYY